MQIGILSDTHGYFHPAIPDYFSDVDVILHAGDVGTEDVLDRLESLAPTHAVLGNVDGGSLRYRASEHFRTSIDGIDFWMTHIGGHPKRWDPRVRHELHTRTPDVFICGHSHILQIGRVDALDRMLFINPGAAGRQGFQQVKTCVRLELADGQIRQAEVIHLDTDV